jgi:cephalosporin hydroxylase
MRKLFKKIFILLSFLPKYPVEVYDHVLNVLEARFERIHMIPLYQYQPKKAAEVFQTLERVLPGAALALTERELVEIDNAVRQKTEEIRSLAPIPLSYNADLLLARLCYVLCRVIKPAVVVETGVAYGLTSAFILQALAVNRQGILHSIDLPPLARSVHNFIGILIPEILKARWMLHRGSSRRILPRVLRQLGQVDIFIHDSMHTYRNLHRELSAVTPYLIRPSVVIADDIDENPAFLEWVKKSNPTFWAAVAEESKASSTGIGIFL